MRAGPAVLRVARQVGAVARPASGRAGGLGCRAALRTPAARAELAGSAVRTAGAAVRRVGREVRAERRRPRPAGVGRRSRAGARATGAHLAASACGASVRTRAVARRATEQRRGARIDAAPATAHEALGAARGTGATAADLAAPARLPGARAGARARRAAVAAVGQRVHALPAAEEEAPRTARLAGARAAEFAGRARLADARAGAGAGRATVLRIGERVDALTVAQDGPGTARRCARARGAGGMARAGIPAAAAVAVVDGRVDTGAAAADLRPGTGRCRGSARAENGERGEERHPPEGVGQLVSPRMGEHHALARRGARRGRVRGLVESPDGLMNQADPIPGLGVRTLALPGGAKRTPGTGQTTRLWTPEGAARRGCSTLPAHQGTSERIP